MVADAVHLPRRFVAFFCRRRNVAKTAPRAAHYRRREGEQQPRRATMVRSYQEQVTLTVQEQLARADANALFKRGDIKDAAAAYEAALEITVLDENRLPLLANLGLCRLRLSEFAAAAECLAAALDLGVACYTAPNLAVKAAGRRLEACQQLGDEAGARAAVADCRFYLQRSREMGGQAPPKLDLPPEPSAEAVTDLLMAVGGAEDAGGQPHHGPNPSPGHPHPHPSRSHHPDQVRTSRCA